MKAWYGILSFLFFLGMATGNTATAFDEPKQSVASASTSTAARSEGPQVIVRAPLFSPLFDRVPLAVVNDDLIFMEDLRNALASSHEERDPAKKLSGGKIDYDKFLERLINVRLIAQEAMKIGLDELPEYKSGVEAYSAQALARRLMEEIKKDVKETDPAAVEKLYKDRVRELKIKSLFFEKEDDAKSVADAIRAGKSFDELAEKAVAEKKAKGVEESNYIKPKDLAPNVVEAVASMETGSVSSVINVQAGKTPGYTILKLEDKRYPENPEAREQAEKDVLNAKKTEVWEQFKTDQFAKNVKIREKFLSNLDLDSPKNNFKKLLEDSRVVADVKGEKPITVGDVMQKLEEIHYHGLKLAAESKKLNKDKRQALFAIISKRVIEKEISERGLARSEAYQTEIKEYKNEALFELFIERVVSPDVKWKESDAKKYFEDHKKEYHYPEMMRMSSLTFGNKHDAESALRVLAKGADFNWVMNNTEGHIARSEDDPISSLNGSILTVDGLSPDMAKAVAGASTGAFRLYEGPQDRFYVLWIQEIIPARQQPYEEVKQLILQKVMDEKFVQVMEDWFRKLREAGKIKIYLSETGK